MASFVHFASKKAIKSVRKGGIKPGLLSRKNGTPCVYAVPVTDDFLVSHQWLRELRRSGQRTVCAVYFRIPDEALVRVGHYNGPHQSMTAAQTVAFFRAPNRQGYEAQIGRKIQPREIYKVRTVRQITGWRYCPDAHERTFCGCMVCVPMGSIRARQKNAAWEAKQNAG